MQLTSQILICWIVIYPVDSAIHLLNNWGLVPVDKTSITWKGLLSSGQTYRAFSHDITEAILLSQNNETVVMLVSQINPVGVEIFSYENAFFCSNKFA